MSLDLNGEPFPRDDRVFCSDCRLLAGLICRADRKDVGERYGPVIELPRRCEFFAAKPGAEDQRTGAERYPALKAEYDTWLAERNATRREAAVRGIGRAKATLALID